MNLQILPRPVRILTLLLGLWVIVACGDDDGTGPPPAIDPARTLASMDSALNQFVLANEALISINGLGSFITAVTGQTAIVPTGVSFSHKINGSEALWALNHSRAPALGQHSGAARIPSALLGATCIWDLQSNRYIDGSIPGAPLDGIRFLFYTLDPVSGLPAAPLNEVGLIDIIDQTSGSTIDVGMASDIFGVTKLTYAVTGQFAAEVQNLRTSGFLTDGSDLMQFDYDVQETQTSSTATLSTAFGVTDLDFSFTAGVGGVASTATFTDTNTGDIIAATLNLDSAGNVTANSDVKFNGVTVAVFSGTIESTTLAPSEGSPLGPSDIQSLVGLVDNAGFLLLTAEDLRVFGLANTGISVAS